MKEHIQVTGIMFLVDGPGYALGLYGPDGKRRKKYPLKTNRSLPGLIREIFQHLDDDMTGEQFVKKLIELGYCDKKP